jgi:hypothetical protein
MSSSGEDSRPDDDVFIAEPADLAACPRCDGKLTDPGGLGWCPGCGYCRSLAEGSAPTASVEPRPKQAPSTLGASELGLAMRHVPGWAWVLLGGVLVVGGTSAAADSLLEEDGLVRALWSALQMLLCLIGLVAAQLWAVLLIGAREEGLGARDIILPGRQWRAALRRLPATRKPVWLGAWSLTGLVCAAIVVGGFGYWLEAVKEKRLRKVVEALSRFESPDQAPPDMATLLTPPHIPLAPAPAPAVDDRRETTHCVVIGYRTDGSRVTGLVVAMVSGDNLKFAGIVKEGIDPDAAPDLRARLARMHRDAPIIPGLRLPDVVWVRPGFFCEVKHAGTDKEGHLERPTISQLTE